jgi:hypothetical protein
MHGAARTHGTAPSKRRSVAPAAAPPPTPRPRHGVLKRQPNVRLVTALDREAYRRLMLAALD